jgi:hypothetical protein
MPVTGRKPKPAGEAVNRNKPTHEWTEVDDVPFDGGPGLPDRRPDGRSWPAWTVETWEAWRSMPHACLWTPADWRFALDTIEVAAKFHDGDARQATELRNREKMLGTTFDSRRDLRIRYVEPKPAALAAVVNADDFRDL